MMKSPIIKIVSIAVWFITAVSAVFVGLSATGFSIFEINFLMAHPMFSTILTYAIGVAGVVSLLMFCMFMSKGGCACGCGSSHNNSYNRPE